MRYLVIYTTFYRKYAYYLPNEESMMLNLMSDLFFMQIKFFCKII